jgi:hypothetical protein
MCSRKTRSVIRSDACVHAGISTFRQYVQHSIEDRIEDSIEDRIEDSIEDRIEGGIEDAAGCWHGRICSCAMGACCCVQSLA